MFPEIYSRSRQYINLQQTRTHHDPIYLKDLFSHIFLYLSQTTENVSRILQKVSQSSRKLVPYTLNTQDTIRLYEKLKENNENPKSSILHFRLPVFNLDYAEYNLSNNTLRRKKTCGEK